MLGRMLSVALVGGAGFFIVAGDAFAGTETIAKPMFNGKRLDWCANWTDDCGKPAADAFCKTQGYGEATVFKRDPHIGAVSPTRVISTGAVCDLAHCDGFLEITCEKLPTVKPEAPTEAEAPAADEPSAPEVADAKFPDDPPAEDVGKTAGTLAASAGEAIADKVGSEDKPIAATAVATPDPGNAPAPTAPPAEKAEVAVEAPAKPVRLASADPAPPRAAMALVHPPTPTPKPARVASVTRVAPVTRAFPAPLFKGKRLDWCRGWKDTCGQTTADDFCRFKGFARAAAFAPDPHIGRRQPTRQIATGMVCDQEMCDGFKVITCAK